MTPPKDHQLTKAFTDLVRRMSTAQPERHQDWYESLPLAAGYMHEWWDNEYDIHLYPLFLVGPTRVRVISFYLGDGTNPINLALALYRAQVPANASLEMSPFGTNTLNVSPADNRYVFSARLGSIGAPQVDGGSYDLLLPKEEVLRPEHRYFLAVQSRYDTVRIPGSHPPQNAGFAVTAYRRSAHMGFKANITPSLMGAWPSELYIVRGDTRAPIHFVFRSTEGAKLWGSGTAPSGL